jgi:hypothetical protein
MSGRKCLLAMSFYSFYVCAFARLMVVGHKQHTWKFGGINWQQTAFVGGCT